MGVKHIKKSWKFPIEMYVNPALRNLWCSFFYIKALGFNQENTLTKVKIGLQKNSYITT